jgi:predicted transposase YbfD/YdcC
MENAGSFIAYFSKVIDPRIERSKRHLLVDIIAIAVCAVICGANQWIEIEAYAQEKKEWLKTFLKLPNGIPSHDTIARVFARIDPENFQTAFLDWVNSLTQAFTGEVIAIDGKTLRGSHERGRGKKALHLISAWATQQSISLGQRVVDDKTNEITEVPKLLKLLVLKGAIVTLDAMGCQRAIARQIREQEADYVLAVKDNQGRLYQGLRTLFEQSEARQFKAMTYSQHNTVDGDHGRVETRCVTVLPSVYLHSLKRHWKDLQSLVQVESHREVKGGVISKEKRYYISSLPMNAQRIAEAVRSHWRIENNLHWSLDVTFREDESRIRKKHAPANVGWLRRLALTLLKKENSFKGSLRRKRFKALMDHRYLMTVIQAN